jgi:hypothetical protein
VGAFPELLFARSRKHKYLWFLVDDLSEESAEGRSSGCPDTGALVRVVRSFWRQVSRGDAQAVQSRTACCAPAIRICGQHKAKDMDDPVTVARS